MADLSTQTNDPVFTMTRDELVAFVIRPNNVIGTAILEATRTDPNTPFSAPTGAKLSGVNAGEGSHFSPRVSSDGLTLYYTRQYLDGTTRFFSATRTTSAAPFGDPNQVSVTGDVGSGRAYFSPDGRTVYGPKFLEQTLVQSVVTPPFSAVAGPQVTKFALTAPVLSADELTLYYADTAEGDIYRTTRPSRNDEFPAGQLVPSLNTTSKEAPLHLTHDGCVLILKSDRPGGLGAFDLYMAKRPR